MGTPRYVAPEARLQGEGRARPLSQAMDVFSFGVIIGELVGEDTRLAWSSGEHWEPSAQPIFNMHPGCKPELGELLQECTRQRPTERPTFAEVVRRLQAIKTQQPSGRQRGNTGASESETRL